MQSYNYLCRIDWIIELIRRFPLEHLNLLREFVITGIVLGWQQLQWMTPLLQKVQTSTSVESLRFQIWYPEAPHAQNLDWDTMKTILIAMPRLRIVELELWGGNSATEMRSIVRQKLEGIEKKCTLKLSGRLD